MFTSATAGKLKAKEKEYWKHDADGLLLRVKPTGRKIWTVQVQENGVRKNIKIGEYPLMSLAEARRKRDEIKIRVHSGLSAEDQSKLTFREAAAEWYQWFLPGKALTHARTIKYRLEHYIYPQIGGVPLFTLTRQDFTSALLIICAGGKIETARRCAEIIQRVMNYALDRGFIRSHEAQRLKAVLPEIKRDQFASIENSEEMGKLLREIWSLRSIVVRSALQITAYCFPRVGELLQSNWNEIDFDAALWTMPAEHTKRKRDHLIPLPVQAVEILKELKEYTAETIYHGQKLENKSVFPAFQTKERGRPIREAALLVALRKISEKNKDIPHMTIHGFRHSASTFLHARGENTLWIEKQLAHLDPNKIRAVYNKYEFLDERRAMLQRYANYLDTLRDKAAAE